MSMVVNLEDYMSAPEAAAELGINYPAFWARIARGKINTIRIGRAHLVKRSAIEKMKVDAHDNTPGLEQTAR